MTGVDWYKDGGQSLRGMLGSRISGLNPGDGLVLGLFLAESLTTRLETVAGAWCAALALGEKDLPETPGFSCFLL